MKSEKRIVYQGRGVGKVRDLNILGMTTLKQAGRVDKTDDTG